MTKNFYNDLQNACFAKMICEAREGEIDLYSNPMNDDNLLFEDDYDEFNYKVFFTHNGPEVKVTVPFEELENKYVISDELLDKLSKIEVHNGPVEMGVDNYDKDVAFYWDYYHMDDYTPFNTNGKKYDEKDVTQDCIDFITEVLDALLDFKKEDIEDNKEENNEENSEKE